MGSWEPLHLPDTDSVHAAAEHYRVDVGCRVDEGFRARPLSIRVAAAALSPERAPITGTSRTRQTRRVQSAAGDSPNRTSPPQRITVLTGGIGAARFLRGLRLARPDAEITAIGNTGDDITLYGLRICPDLDTVTYTLAGMNDEAQGWGIRGESWHALEELRAFLDPPSRTRQPGSLTDQTSRRSEDGEPDLTELAARVPTWFGLGDRDLGTHLVRTALLQQGYPLSEVTALLTARWELGVRLLPMTDQPVETHVLVDELDDTGQPRTLHFQEYWVGRHASVPVRQLVFRGIEQATPAPGVLNAIENADVILFPPSNPVVSIGPILAVPGVADAVRAAAGPVIGLSPIIGGAPVRGMADKLLPAIGVPTTADGVALHFGPDLLDGWLVDSSDAAAAPAVRAAGIACRAVPLWMSSPEASAEMADQALRLAAELPTGGGPTRTSSTSGRPDSGNAAGAEPNDGAPNGKDVW